MCFGRTVCYAQVVAKMPVASKAFFSKDMTLAKTMLACCKAVLEGSDAEVEAVKKGFSASSAASSSADGGITTVATLGKAPPTATFAEISGFASLQAVPATVYTEVMVKDDYKPLRQELVKSLAPAKDLISALKERFNSFKTRKDAYKNEKSNKFGDIAAPSLLRIFISSNV